MTIRYTKMRSTVVCILSAIMLLLCFVAYDVAQLQAGINAPDHELHEAANDAAFKRLSVKAISDYDELSVKVSDNVTVTVAMRETPSAEANLLLIHGAASGAWAWEYFFENLPLNYNLYALNWRGQFTSSDAENARSTDYVSDQEAALAAVLKRSSLPTHIIGHSYGGATAILQVAQTRHAIESLILLAPVVPLEYSFFQSLIVPRMAPYFIRKNNEKGNDPSGIYGDMFLSENIMQDYFKRYASENHAKENSALISGDGVSIFWQEELFEAYKEIGHSTVPLTIFSARYDNVVVPKRQCELADRIGATFIEVKSGHYLPLDSSADKLIMKLVDILGDPKKQLGYLKTSCTQL